MKLYTVFAVLSLFLLVACGGNNAGQESETAAQEEAAPAADDVMTMPLTTEMEIEDWVAQVVMDMEGGQEFPTSPTKEITVGDKTWQASVVNPDGRISLVRAAYPGWGEPTEVVRYLSRDGRVVLFEEYLKTGDQFKVDKIYYSEDGMVLSSSTRTGPTLAEARNAVPGEFEPEPGDIFENYEAVRETAETILTLFQEN